MGIAVPARRRARARPLSRSQRALSYLLVAAALALCLTLVPRVRHGRVAAIAKRALVALDEVGEHLLARLTAQASSGEDDKGGGGNLLHIPYLHLYEQAPIAFRPLVIALLVLVLLFLFCSISITASDFFCPNLATMAAFLGLSESTAGVTLLAFGNGSPDVFSTFVAMREGTFGLAVGELIGAASFITSIVVGSIAMVRPFHVPRYPFLRDAAFFTAAVLSLMVVLRDGRLTLRESGAMVTLYTLYVSVVIAGNWWQRRKRRRAEHEELGWKVNPPSDDETTPGVLEPPEAQLVPLPHDSAPLLTPPSSRTVRRLPSSESMPGLPIPDARHHQKHEYDEDAQRAGFSLLGAVEFRDVVKHLQHDLSPSSSRHGSRPSSPLRTPTDGNEGDYFHHTHHHHSRHHRRSSSQGLAIIDPALRRMSRSRSASLLHPSSTSRSRQASGEYPDNLSPVPGSPGALQAEDDAESVPLSPLPPSSPALRQQELHVSIPNGERAPESPTSIDLPHLAVTEPSGALRRPTMPLTRSNTVDSVAKRGVAAFHKTIHTLFPSLQGFRHKSVVGMALAILSVPAIFILTLTLPVVDDGRGDEGGVALPLTDDEPLTDGHYNDEDEEDEDEDRPIRPEIGEGLHHLVDRGARLSRQPSTNFVRSGAVSPCGSDRDDESCCSQDSDDCDTLAFNPKLTAAQCICGPSVCAYLAFQDEDYLWWVILGSVLAGSVAAIAVLKLATDGHQQPWRLVRCCCGFICSMVWIGSIADEVVAVLSTFGEVFGLSNAIIGLTSELYPTPLTQSLLLETRSPT